MRPDVFTRIREDVIQAGGYDTVVTSPITIREIAFRNGVTVTAVRQTLTQMNQEHRQARRTRRLLLDALPSEERHRLREIKNFLLDATQHIPLPRPGDLPLVIAGSGTPDDPVVVGLIPPGRREPDRWVTVTDLLALARLALLE